MSKETKSEQQAPKAEERPANLMKVRVLFASPGLKIEGEPYMHAEALMDMNTGRITADIGRHKGVMLNRHSTAVTAIIPLQ